MSNPNFVSDLVAMAKAFEELPQAKATIDAMQRQAVEDGNTIQRLELRLIDLKNELTAAHAEIKKVEVERDHAERMFLETDDRLNAFRRLVQAFDTDVKSLVQAAEPEPEVKPEDLSSVVEQMNAAAEPEPKPEPTIAPSTEQSKEIMAGWAQSQPEPGPAVGDAFTLGQGDVDPTLAVSSTTSQSTSALSTAESVESAKATATEEPQQVEAVSVQPDPTPATPDAQHSPAGSSASAGESNATTETAGSTQPEHMQGSIATGDWGRPIAGNGNGDPSEVTAPADPTASSTAGDGHSSGNVEATSPVSTQADATSDDVGYHNEPKIGPAGGPEAWHDWDNWCSRMNRKYGGGSWPARPTLHGDREAAAQ